MLCRYEDKECDGCMEYLEYGLRPCEYCAKIDYIKRYEKVNEEENTWQASTN